MKKSDFLLLGILCTIIVLSLLNLFIGFFNQYILFAFTILLLGFSVWQVGYQKNKSMIEKDVVLSITAYLIFYYLISYILGYFIGFIKNVYSIEFKTMIGNILPVIINIFACEILRYVLNTRAKNHKGLIILSFIAFTLMNNTILIRGII